MLTPTVNLWGNKVERFLSQFAFKPQDEMKHMNMRVDAAEEYLRSLVGESLDAFGKGEWIGAVRSKTLWGVLIDKYQLQYGYNASHKLLN